MPGCRIPKRWAVVAVCFLINYLQMGTARMAGLLFLAVKDLYGVPRGPASLPFTLCHAVRNIFGPCSGYLASRFGVRAVTSAGCFVSFAGIACCFFAQEVIALTILWAGVYGIGFSMGNSLLPHILNEHFTKNKSLVNGISLGGSSVAGFLMPIYVDQLLKFYGLSGTFLILAACILQCLPLSMLFWTLKATPVKVAENRAEEIELPNTSITAQEQENAEQLIPLHSQLSRSDDFGVTEGIAKTTPDGDPKKNTFLVPNDPSRVFDDAVTDVETKSTSRIHTSKKELKDNTNSPKKSSQSIFTVFIDPTFILIALTQSTLIYIGVFIVTINIDLGRDSGIADYQEPYLLISMSICDLIGRFCLSYVPDSGYLTVVQFSAICFSVMGVFFLATVFVSGFAFLIVLMCIYGLFGGCLLAFSAVICFQFIEKEKVTMALTSRFFLQAPMTLTQSPLIALFREHYGSYNGVLILLSVLSFLCSLMTFLTPIAAKRRDKKKLPNTIEEVPALR